jgi:hypothetical protein
MGMNDYTSGWNHKKKPSEYEVFNSNGELVFSGSINEYNKQFKPLTVQIRRNKWLYKMIRWIFE